MPLTGDRLACRSMIDGALDRERRAVASIVIDVPPLILSSPAAFCVIARRSSS